MMVGLPGAGKTFWAEEWKKRHPDKNYNILVINIHIHKIIHTQSIIDPLSTII
jgi:GTPase SAR1 family protein